MYGCKQVILYNFECRVVLNKRNHFNIYVTRITLRGIKHDDVIHPITLYHQNYIGEARNGIDLNFSGRIQILF